MKIIERVLGKLGYFKFTSKNLLKPEYLDIKIGALKCQWSTRYYTANKIGISLNKDNNISINIYQVPQKNGKPDTDKMAIQKLMKGTVFIIDGKKHELTEDVNLTEFNSKNVFPITSSSGEFLYYDIHVETKKISE